MIDSYRFINPTAASVAPAPAQPANPAPLGARPDLSDDANADPQGLAAAIMAAGRQPQGSATGMAANLAAEALLQYAQRNRMAGQADPSDSGGGGYGAVPSDPGAQRGGPGAKPPGLAGALINMGLQTGAPQVQGFMPSNWLGGDFSGL